MSPHGRAGWAGSSFGAAVSPVNSIMAHFTAGWPRRDAANNFVSRFTTNAEPTFHGIGPQLYISGDGTIARLIQIDPPLHTGHAEWLNAKSVGVETGNLGTVGAPPSPQWVRVSDDDDLLGLALWVTAGTPAQSEVVPSWWTTDNYLGPGRDAVNHGHMRFSEPQQQAWAMLARYLFELFALPRNLPLLPHLSRSSSLAGAGAADAVRRIVLADERSDMIQRVAVALPHTVPQGSFAQAAGFQALYEATQVAATAGVQSHNGVYRAWTEAFRGLFSHRAAGSMLIFHGSANGEHDCPGPLFDFHRLAREVSDYWWYPFDVANATSAVTPRPYRTWHGDTPILEYYWDETLADRTGRFVTGAHGVTSSPDTFRLEPASPVYALSNGELVAARLPAAGADPSTGFVLVRHDVYWSPPFQGLIPPLVPAVSIDYDIAPESVYTLYMHVARPADMTFTDMSLDNPDWLNRLILRKKECDLGTAFYDAPPAKAGDPAHHGIPAAMWNNRPPGVPARTTTLSGWRADHLILTTFFDDLINARIACVPRQGLAVPARIVLGDLIANSGVVAHGTNPQVSGVRIETFAPSFQAPTFAPRATTDWTPPSVLLPPLCLQYQSEWARPPTAAERLVLSGNGFDPDALNWWNKVVVAQTDDGSLDEGDRLPVNGVVSHYRPLEFAAWINGATWASEWPKYQVVDAANAPVARPAHPRSRRV